VTIWPLAACFCRNVIASLAINAVVVRVDLAQRQFGAVVLLDPRTDPGA